MQNNFFKIPIIIQHDDCPFFGEYYDYVLHKDLNNITPTSKFLKSNTTTRAMITPPYHCGIIYSWILSSNACDPTCTRVSCWSFVPCIFRMPLYFYFLAPHASISSYKFYFFHPICLLTLYSLGEYFRK